MSSISELYQRSLQPSFVVEATAALLEIYKDPSNLGNILEIITSDPKPITRRQAAIGLRTMLNMHWDGLVAAGHADQIKTQILAALENEPIQEIRHAIINTFDSILMLKSVKWPELKDYANSLLSNENVDAQEVALTIYGIIAPNMDIYELNEALSGIRDIIITGMKSGNELLMLAAAHLTETLATIFEAPAPIEVQECFKSLLELFRHSLLAESDMAYKLGNELSGCTLSNSCISPQEFLNSLLELSFDEEIPKTQSFIIFTPISDLISNRYEEIQESTPDIIHSMMINVAASFIEEDNAEGQSDAYYICGTLADLIERSDDSSSLFDAVCNDISTETNGGIFAGSYLLQIFIERAPGVCANNIELIMNFFDNQLSSGTDSPAVIAIIFQAIQMFIRVANAGLEAYSQRMLEYGISAAQQCEDEVAASSALNMLQELLTTIDVDLKNYGEFLQALVDIACNREGDVRERALFAIYAFLFAAGDIVKDDAQNIYQIYVEAHSVAFQSGDSKLVATSLLGMAQLHKSCQAEMSPLIENTIKAVSEAFSCEEVSVITAALTAASILCEVSGSNEFITLAINNAVQTLQQPLPEREEETEDLGISEEERELFELKASCLDLIIAVLKKNHELLQPIAQMLLDCVFELIANPMDEDVSALAVECISHLTEKFNIDRNEIIAQTGDALYSPYQLTVQKIFTMTAKFVKSGAELSQTQLQMFIEAADAVLENDLPCLDPDEEENDVTDSAVKFLSTIAKVHPEMFNKDKYIAIARKLGKKKADVRMYYAYILGKFLSLYPENMMDVERKTVMRFVHEAVENCDGYVQPLGLKVLYKLLFRQFDQVAGEAKALIENMSGFSTECESGPYFRESVCYIATIALMLAQKGATDIGMFIDAIVKALPVTIPGLSNVFYTILQPAFLGETDKFSESITLILVGIAKLFSLRASEFNEIKLTVEASKSAATVANFILQNAEGSSDVVVQALGLQKLVDVFQRRITHYLSQ